MKKFDQFLFAKSSSIHEETQFCAYLLLSVQGNKELLRGFTADKIRQLIKDRRTIRMELTQ